MEDKKYEAGKVEITSTEYRDLVIEAVEARNDASQERSRRWELDSELRKVKEELELTRKRVQELEAINEAFRSGKTQLFNIPSDSTKPWWSEVTCQNTPSSVFKEDI